MPELPEVEIMARLARRVAAGRTIRSFDLVDPAVLVGGGLSPDLLVGAAVTRVRRRAKHLIIETSHGDLAIHLRMTGKIVATGGDDRVRFSVGLDDGGVLALRDTRRLGELRVLPVAGAERWVESLGLGPDAWPEAGDGLWWAARFATVRSPIKPALLDQRRVAGIGNILASELLWRAGIAPARPVPALSPTDWATLAARVGPLIDEVIEAETDAELTYVNEGGSNAAFAVYGRADGACRRCGAKVLRFVQAARSTFWCEGCQR